MSSYIVVVWMKEQGDERGDDSLAGELAVIWLGSLVAQDMHSRLIADSLLIRFPED